MTIDRAKMESGSPRVVQLSPLRTRRREALVDAAAGLIDAAGVAALDFPALAAAAGCSRAVLYRYFADRGEVIFHVYRRSCQHALQQLPTLAGTTARDRLASFITRMMAASAPAQVVVSETSMLAPAHRREIETLTRQLHDAVGRMLRDGAADGSMRRCNDAILARSICAMLDFARTARRWAEPGQVATAAEMIDLVVHGSASDPDYVFDRRDSVDMFSQIGVRNLRTADLADFRSEQILMTASGMFNRRGIENVTLEEVAEELNMTRGVIYHYFRNRQDLLVHCLDRGLGLYHAIVDHAERRGRNGLEKSLIVTHLNTQALAGPLQPVVPWFGFESLAGELQQRYFGKLRDLVARVAAVHAAGRRDGSRRPGQDSTIVARGGAFNWMPGSIDGLGGGDSFAIADEITRFIAHGVRA